MKRSLGRLAAGAAISLLVSAGIVACGGSGGDGSPAESRPSSTTLGAGGLIGLDGSVEVAFPQGAADGRLVSVSRTVSADWLEVFNTVGDVMFGSTAADFQIVVKVAGQQPALPVFVRLQVPSSLRNQAPASGELRAFYRVLQRNELEEIETIEPLGASVALNASAVEVFVPPSAFQSETGLDGSYEAVLYLAFVTPDTGSSAAGSSSQKSPLATGSAACGRDKLRSPIKGAPITSRFGRRTDPQLGGQQDHTGTDFSVATGTPVRAMGSGVVSTVRFNEKVVNGKKKGYGHYMVIKHNDGSTSLYGHLLGGTLLPVGTQVVAGETVIAQSDNSGGSTAPHLHAEYAPNGDTFGAKSRVDPLACIEEALTIVYDVTTTVTASEVGPRVQRECVNGSCAAELFCTADPVGTTKTERHEWLLDATTGVAKVTSPEGTSTGTFDPATGGILIAETYLSEEVTPPGSTYRYFSSGSATLVATRDSTTSRISGTNVDIVTNSWNYDSATASCKTTSTYSATPVTQ